MKPNILDIEIAPRDKALLRMGASRSDFSTALDLALNRLATKSRGELPGPTDIPIDIRGQSHRLGEVAVIRVKLRTRPAARA